MTSQGDGDAPFHARLLPSGLCFPAPGDATLLDSAARHGIALPSSCRNGTCRTCLKPLRTGTVEYRIPWPGLLPEEKHAGWVLPCVAYPRSDVVLGD